MKPFLVVGALLAPATFALFSAEFQDPKGAEKAAPSEPALASVAAFEYGAGGMTSFTVKDVAAAKAWYGTVLGCKTYYDLPAMGWAEVTTPVKGVYLGLATSEKAAGSGDACLAFPVKDMAKARAWLVENKVSLDGDVIEIPGAVKLLYFRDPDANKLFFYQPLP